MAKVTSGSFNTTAYSNRYIIFSWSATQSIADNTSIIKWSIRGAGSATGYYKAGPITVVIAGETVYSSTARINLYNSTTAIASGEKVITHNSDGSKSFTASVSAAIYSASVNCSGSGSWELTDIPRAATITSAPNFTDEQSPTINISNPAGSAATVSACISFDGSSIDIPYRSVTGSSVTFNLTDAERNTLRNATTGNSRVVYFVLRSIINGSYYFKSVAKTLTIVNANPVIAPSVTDTGTVSTRLTGNNKRVIFNYNNAYAAINATAQKGATIKSVSISNGGNTVKDAATRFNNTASATFVFTAIDSRGNKTERAITCESVAYFKPTCNIAKNNITPDGIYTLSVSGQFFNGSFGAANNTIAASFRFRESGGTWSGWQSLGTTASGNDYSASANITGLDYQQTYEIQARAIDTIATNDTNYIVNTEVITIASVPVFSWGKNKFRHHAHTYYDRSKNIYSYDDEGNLWAALEPCNAYNATSLGWGSYKLGKGNTEVWGNTVKITAKDKLYINSREYGANKLLWSSGGWWMQTDQVANLNQAISAQPNGIVLVWSLYRNDAVENASFQSFFVSKYEVAQQDNKPHTFLFGINSNLSVFGAKYVYISDTAITGYSGNTFYGTASGSGITYDNRYFVLRYVLGV